MSSLSPSSCLVLDASTPCGPLFSGYPVLSQYFPTVGAFSDAINRLSGTGDTFAAYISQSSMCVPSETKSALTRLRYQSSIWCASVVTDAIASGCPLPTSHSTGPLLCQTPCQEAVNTLSSLLTNETVCPSKDVTQDAASARSSTLMTLQTYCNTTRATMAANASLECVQGTPTETRLCGWTDQILAVSQCMNRPNDTCCEKFINDSKPTASPTLSPTRSATFSGFYSPTPASTAVSLPSSATGAASSTEVSGSKARMINPAVFPVLGSCFGILILVAIGAYIFHERKKARLAEARKKLFEPMMDTPPAPNDLGEKHKTLEFQPTSTDITVEDDIDLGNNLQPFPRTNAPKTTKSVMWNLSKNTVQEPPAREMSPEPSMQNIMPRTINERKSSKPPTGAPSKLRGASPASTFPATQTNMSSSDQPQPEEQKQPEHHPHKVTLDSNMGTQMSENIPLSDIIGLRKGAFKLDTPVQRDTFISSTDVAQTPALLHDFGLQTPLSLDPNSSYSPSPKPPLKDEPSNDQVQSSTAPYETPQQQEIQYNHQDYGNMNEPRAVTASFIVPYMGSTGHPTQSMIAYVVSGPDGTYDMNQQYMAVYPSYIPTPQMSGIDMSQSYIAPDPNTSMIFVPQATDSSYSLAGPPIMEQSEESTDPQPGSSS